MLERQQKDWEGTEASLKKKGKFRNENCWAFCNLLQAITYKVFATLQVTHKRNFQSRDLWNKNVRKKINQHQLWLNIFQSELKIRAAWVAPTCEPDLSPAQQGWQRWETCNSKAWIGTKNWSSNIHFLWIHRTPRLTLILDTISYILKLICSTLSIQCNLYC